MKMKHLFILLLAALSVAACNRTGNAGGETLTVDELLAKADALVGDTVRVEGLCVSTCGHGSTHITLMGSDTTQMVEALKGQIRELRDSIAARQAREGKEYWSIYRIETFACHAIDDEAGR